MSEVSAAFQCNEIGMTMGDTKIEQLPDGRWKASSPIGSLFGAKVDGECAGYGSTKEIAIAALAEDRKQLHESLWI